MSHTKKLQSISCHKSIDNYTFSILHYKRDCITERHRFSQLKRIGRSKLRKAFEIDLVREIMKMPILIIYDVSSDVISE